MKKYDVKITTENGKVLRSKTIDFRRIFDEFYDRADVYEYPEFYNINSTGSTILNYLQLEEFIPELYMLQEKFESAEEIDDLIAFITGLNRDEYVKFTL